MNSMKPVEQDAISAPKSVLKGLIISLVINVGIPLLIIYILTTYLYTSEILALSIASIVPILNSLLEIVRHHRLDMIATIFLLGAVTNILAIVLGGSVQLLVIRESFFSGALGLVCLLSLLIVPRPLMFYIGRQMLAGNDPVKVQNFNARWYKPGGRFANRLITAVWGCALFGEFLVRIVIAFTLTPTLAYAIGSTLLTITLALTFLWTFAYIRLLTRREQAAQTTSRVSINE